MRSYYREVIYYMHQPQSQTIKVLLLSMYAYAFIKFSLAYQDEFRTVFLRKRQRVKDIEMGAREPITKDEHIMIEELKRLTYMR